MEACAHGGRHVSNRAKEGSPSGAPALADTVAPSLGAGTNAKAVGHLIERRLFANLIMADPAAEPACSGAASTKPGRPHRVDCSQDQLPHKLLSGDNACKLVKVDARCSELLGWLPRMQSGGAGHESSKLP